MLLFYLERRLFTLSVVLDCMTLGLFQEGLDLLECNSLR